MSGESEHFVRRWSRLKRKTARTGSASPVEPDSKEPRTGGRPAPAADHLQAVDADAAATPAVDLESLPAIDSITGDTDIRAFLRSGVPAELTKAALRKVWTSDPAIRDFIEMAENQWDFTDPNAIPGFGPMDSTAGAYDLASETLGSKQEAGLEEQVPSQAQESSAPERPETASTELPENTDPKESASQPRPAQDEVRIAASQQEDEPAERSIVGSRRSHGRAIPR